MLKKRLAFLLCLLLLFGALFACSPKQPSADQEAQPLTVDGMLRSVLALSCTALDQSGNAVRTADGSGVIVKLTGQGAYLVTNYHVIQDPFATEGEPAVCGRITAAPYGAEQSVAMAASCIWYSKSYDLALLHIADLSAFPGAAAARIDLSHSASLGEAIFAIGNANGAGLALHKGAVTRPLEYVSLPLSYADADVELALIRYDASVSEGDSGGALFAADGTLLGIVNARRKDGGGGYAIPLQTVLPITERVLSSAENGSPAASLLRFGAVLEEVSLGTSFDEEQGVLVTDTELRVKELAVGSVASVFLSEGDALLGLQKNDQERQKLDSRFALESALLSAGAGDRLTFYYRRDGAEATYTVLVEAIHLETVD